jgi:hypothetical protein
LLREAAARLEADVRQLLGEREGLQLALADCFRAFRERTQIS